MQIQITKRADGAGVLRCTRADGSVTWQKLPDRHAGIFALHDLTHLAVESVLGFKQGFFGLLAAGWDISDTSGKGVRGPLPPEAIEVEHIVGFFDTERRSGARFTVEDYDLFALPTMRRLTDEQMAKVRARRGELYTQWAAVLPGAALEVKFPYSE